MSALGAIILGVLILVVLSGSRLQALVALTCGALFLSQAQQINLMGLNLFAIRFLEAAGFARVMARREFSFTKANNLDRGLFWLYAYTTLVFLVRSKEGYLSAIALAVDAGLCYVTFRGLIPNLAGFVRFLYVLPFLFLPYVFLLAIERRTGHAALSIMAGGVQGIFIRDGVNRCMGSFRNPDLLGSVGASFLPCYIALCLTRYRPTRALLGLGLCLLIVWFSHSGGPLSATAVALSGWALWRWRTMMRQIRWAMAGGPVGPGFVFESSVLFSLL